MFQRECPRCTPARVVRVAASTCALALALGSGCGGQAVEHDYFLSSAGATHGGGVSVTPSGGTAHDPSLAGDGSAGVAGAGEPVVEEGGAAGATSEGGGAGASETGGASGASGADGSSGDAGEAGEGGAASDGGAPSQKLCASVNDCARPANACLKVLCVSGSCVTQYVPAGPLFALDVPADCHVTTACDGLGNATLEIGQGNTPISNNPCLAGTCNDAGVASTEPRPSGARCTGDFGRGKCDGLGACVACLTTPDCPLGQTCNSVHSCIGKPCSATNCGGACPACAPLDPQCVDQKQDGNETAVDCGGGTCAPCSVGQACLFDLDCASVGCDASSKTCVASPCVDHHLDDDESDLDCGGADQECPRCGVGQKCRSNFDCIPGHFCNGVRECQ